LAIGTGCEGPQPSMSAANGVVRGIANDLEGVRSLGAVGFDRDFVLLPFSIDRIAETK
jgi:hypothetical protein